ALRRARQGRRRGPLLRPGLAAHAAGPDAAAVQHIGVSGAPVLLHGPGVAVGVVEEEVAGAGGAFGAELLDVADGDAAAGQGLADGVDVGDDELDALDRAGVAEGQALADDDRAGRAGRGHLHDAHGLVGADVVVEVEADPLGVEGLGGVDVGDRDGDDLQPHLDVLGGLLHASSLGLRMGAPILRGGAVMLSAAGSGGGAVAGELDGLVAAVTGGGSGIGLATVRLLAARGARVAALDLDPAAAAEAAPRGE